MAHALGAITTNDPLPSVTHGRRRRRRSDRQGHYYIDPLCMVYRPTGGGERACNFGTAGTEGEMLVITKNTLCGFLIRLKMMHYPIQASRSNLGLNLV